MFGVLLKLWACRKYAVPAVLVVALVGVWKLSQYRLAQRDDAVAARVIAEDYLKRTTESRSAVIRALEIDMEENRDRDQFERQTGQAQAALRFEGGDGPLAPVLADTLDRLRSRQHARAAAAP